MTFLILCENIGTSKHMMFADFEVQLLLLQVLPLPSPRFQAGREDHSLKHSSYVPWFTGIFSKTAVMDRG